MKRFFIFLILAAFGVMLLYAFTGAPRGSERISRTDSRGVDRSREETPLNAIAPQRGNSLEGVKLSPIEKFGVWLARKTKEPYLHIVSDWLKFGRDGSGTLENAQLTFVAKDETSQPPLDVRAARLHAPFGGNPPRPMAGPMKAEDATIIYRGRQLGKSNEITIHIPTLTTVFRGSEETMEPESFHSPDAFNISGDGLRGSGTGIDGDLLKNSIRITKDPSLEILPGKLQKSRNHLLIRSAGPAFLEAPREWLSESSARFTEKAFFRMESTDRGEFLETNAREISANFTDSGTNKNGGENALHIRKFAAVDGVVFKTNSVEGSCNKLDGRVSEDETIEELVLRGRYRMDFTTPRSSTIVPGAGAPEKVYLEGEETLQVLSEGGDSKHVRYHVTALGKPKLVFKDRETGKLSKIFADDIQCWLEGEKILYFEARGHVRVENDLGVGLGDLFIVRDITTKPVAVLSSGGEAELFVINIVPGESAPLEQHLFAREMEFRPADGKKTSCVARHGVRGSLTGRKASRLDFSCKTVEAELQENDLRSVELVDAVDARSISANTHLSGFRLSLKFTEKGAASTESALALPKNALLTGSPAVVEELHAIRGPARVLFSPEIRFNGDQIVASGPVEVSVPFQSVFGRAIAQNSSAEGSETMLWIGGSRLEAQFNAEGRQTSATLTGPLSSRGDLELVGEQLILNFINGEHYLIAREGERARIRSISPGVSPRFSLESSRIDFRSSDEAVVLAANGIVEILDTGFDFGNVTSKDPLSPRGNNRLRITAAGRSELNRREVVFRDNVVATGSDSQDREIWNMKSGFLSVVLDGARGPRSVRSNLGVQFEIVGRVKGKCDDLYTERSSELFELKSEAPRESALDLGSIQFRGPWLRLNTRTYLVDTGSASVTTSTSSRPR